MKISDLGINIKRFREKKGWSLSKLKQESGVGYATLHDIENGKSQNLNSKNLEKVANALNVTIDNLLNIDILEYTVTDIEETLKVILESDELKLDGNELDSYEKEELEEFFKLALNNIRRRRRKYNNENNSNL